MPKIVESEAVGEPRRADGRLEPRSVEVPVAKGVGRLAPSSPVGGWRPRTPSPVSGRGAPGLHIIPIEARSRTRPTLSAAGLGTQAAAALGRSDPADNELEATHSGIMGTNGEVSQ